MLDEPASCGPTAILWLRRDLRRSDHPALAAAAAEAAVLPVFVLDPEFLGPAGAVRTAWLAATLAALDEAFEGRLCLRLGDPVQVLPALAAELNAATVHISAESEPAGAARDRRVETALAAVGVALIRTGSPYAVTPGRLVTNAGGGYRVFTPFLRAWREHGWRGPATEPDGLRLATAPSDPAAWPLLETALRDCPIDLPPAGESAALARWTAFLDGPVERYAIDRDRPDLDGSSRLSPYLKFGVVHPRTLLADLAGRPGLGAERFVAELAWREFYADVLHHHPASLAADLHPLGIGYDSPGEQFTAWRDGRTGYPIVDAGMRQLLTTGWMHNRVRMITASFLTKDLHLWWPQGAAHFLEHLIDADLASNAHGWQWVAGTGTDAAPYFRVFNPISQGERFDPDGDYVRRFVPELRHLSGASAHRPWEAADGYAQGYPQRIVDHAEERRDALARLSSRPAPG